MENWSLGAFEVIALVQGHVTFRHEQNPTGNELDMS